MLYARVGRYSENPDPCFVERDSRSVNISEATRKCVAFLGTREDGVFHPRATCFFVSYLEEQHRFDHLVTAEHVIGAPLSAGHDIWLRVNLTNGDIAEVPIEHDAFRYHPNEMERTDVAVAPIVTELNHRETGDKVRMDILTLPLNGKDSFAPTQEFIEHSMGPGGQIAIVGLFRSHYGKKRNIPIVRVGNIAAAPEEPVRTNWAGYIKAYLVEARSIAGLSGSPVFAMIDSTALLNVMLQVMGRRGEEKIEISQPAALIGLMHGHFDVPNLNEDVVSDNGRSSVNTGIGVVVPFEKIIETVEHPDLTARRKEIVRKLREEHGATADVLADQPPKTASPPSDENSNHREDFMRLLSAAAKTPPQDE